MTCTCRNFFEAIIAGKPELATTPDLGAAAVVTIGMGKNSYRNDKVYYFDPEARKVTEGDGSWSRQWEAMSKAHASPHQVPGWHAGNRGSTLQPPEFSKTDQDSGSTAAARRSKR